MRWRLTRSNDDPNLLNDLERLAREHGPPDRQDQPFVAESAPGNEEPASDGAGPATEGGSAGALEDPFVRRFVQVSVHAKRYAPFYSGAFAFALVLLLIQPIGGRGGDGPPTNADGLAIGRQQSQVITSSSDAEGAAVDATELAPAPTFDAFGGSSGSAPSAFGFGDGQSAALDADSPPSSSDGSYSADNDTVTFDDESFPDSDADEGPEPLEIIASGYASTTGGTPLEQSPPNGGLPVAATGGNENKRSFIRLSGDDIILRLQIDPKANNVQPETASIKACPIAEADWKAERGQPMAEGPAVSKEFCATGSGTADGLWTWDLSGLPPVEGSNGLALIVGPGTALTFQVVFQPVVVPAED